MHNGTLLLADNYEPYRDSLIGPLEDAGYKVLQAPSLKQAKLLLRMVPALDSAIVDLRMVDDTDPHDLSGLEVAHLANELGIPCIINTAHPSSEATRRALRHYSANAWDSVSKGIAPDELVNVIEASRGISLVQVSDLHLGTGFDQEQILRTLAADALAQPGSAFNPIKGIVFCGDVSLAGPCEKAFVQALTVLHGFCDELNLDLSEVVLTPGNHEISWPNAPSLANAASRRYAQMELFLAFSERFYDKSAFSSQRPFRVHSFGDRLAVVAFNSCVREGIADALCSACQKSGKSHYYGWIVPEDVTAASTELSKNEYAQACKIAVIHHDVAATGALPGACSGSGLRNFDDKRDQIGIRLYQAGIRLLLHGHRHTDLALQSSDINAQQPLRIGCGTLGFGADHEGCGQEVGYVLLQLSPVYGRSRVIFRRYRPTTYGRAGEWVANQQRGYGDTGIEPLPFRLSTD